MARKACIHSHWQSAARGMCLVPEDWSHTFGDYSQQGLIWQQPLAAIGCGCLDVLSASGVRKHGARHPGSNVEVPHMLTQSHADNESSILRRYAWRSGRVELVDLIGSRRTIYTSEVSLGRPHPAALTHDLTLASLTTKTNQH